MVTPVKLLNNRYKILQTLGRGGFGETFLAQDTHLPSARRCVIKHLKPVLESSDIPGWLRERFQREAAILEELGENHGQIPELYAYFNEGDDFYLVQEWIPGLTLTQAQEKRGNFSSTAVEELLLGILPVLEFIHQRRIIHRDIKPDNIILRERDGKPILIDFGIIKETMGTLVNPDGRSAYSVALGTPGYMASEQAAGRPVFSSDLYSLGLTAIFLLTGKTPQYLTSDSRTGEILWRQMAPQVSPTLASVLDQAIRYHPRERFSSATAMGKALFSSFNSVGGSSSSYLGNYQTVPVNNARSPEKTAPTLVVGNSYNANDTKATRVYSQEFTQYPEDQKSSPLIKWVVMPLVVLLVVLGGMAGGFWVTNQRRNQPPEPVQEPVEETPSPLPSLEPKPKLFEDPPPPIPPTPEPAPSETPEPEPSPEVSEPVAEPETPGPEQLEEVNPIPEISPAPTIPPEPAPSTPVPVTPSPINPTPAPSPSPKPTAPNSSGSFPQPSNEIPVIPPPEKPSNDGDMGLPAPPAAEKPVNPEQN